MTTIIASAVNTVAALNLAIEAADTKVANGGTYEIDLASSGTIALGTTELEAINLNAGNVLVIEGDNATIDGGGAQRGLFDYAGSLIVSKLTIANAAAIGGAGGAEAGGGAGLGGGLFIAAAGSVELQGVRFTGDLAAGGAGSGAIGEGGGGGLGGAGGLDGGGGGIGSSATGGGAEADGGPGIVPRADLGGSGEGSTGGIYGGGGGYTAGGGIGGGSASFSNAGNGGFGGGGGAVVNDGTGGAGGFGGGGGYSDGNTGNSGGFGGGGGGGNVFVGGNGGFGGGTGGNAVTGLGDQRGGGGGLGAGGAIFVQQGGQLTLGYGSLSGGSVLYGAAGVSPHGAGDATKGSAFGSGIFIQGTQSIGFAPAAGQTLTVSDVIADQSGSGGSGTLAGAGSVTIDGAGLVDLAADNSYSGGTAIDAGTLEIGASGSAGAGAIRFGAPEVTLRIDAVPKSGSTYRNTLDGLTAGDTIDLSGVAFVSGATASIVGSTLKLIDGGFTEHFSLTAAHASAADVSRDPAGGTFIVACFVEGTRILTAAGEVPIEALRPGDRISRFFGGEVPLVWLGHRRIDCRRHPRPTEVWPVRVSAHAFGAGQPARDLLLSPDHSVYVDGVLIPIRYLINGATIAQDARDEVMYYHIELPAHEVLLAEGLPAESFLDTGNRSAFDNGGTSVDLHAEFALD